MAIVAEERQRRVQEENKLCMSISGVVCSGEKDKVMTKDADEVEKQILMSKKKKSKGKKHRKRW